MAAATLGGVDHPWRRLRHLPQWELVWCDDLPVDVAGLTDHGTCTIRMRKGMLQAQRRSTLAHELEHVERGPAPAEPVLRAREEAAVELAAARRMISIEALGEAMAWSQDPAEIADDLWVDRALLMARLTSLHPAERAYLHRRLEAEL